MAGRPAIIKPNENLAKLMDDLELKGNPRMRRRGLDLTYHRGSKGKTGVTLHDAKEVKGAWQLLQLLKTFKAFRQIAGFPSESETEEATDINEQKEQLSEEEKPKDEPLTTKTF